MNKFSAMANGGAYPATPTTPAYRNGIAAATALYNLKEDNSLSKNEKFSDLLGTKGDMHFWLNGESFNSGMNMAALSMVNITKLTEGSIATATASFENGQILVDTKSYSGKELSDIWKKYSGDKISSDMAKRVPSKNVAAFVALNFKPEGIREVVKLTGMEGLINVGMSQLGLTFDDFVKANKGDILFVVSDVQKDSANHGNVNILFSTSIGDKASFAKLVEAGKKIGGSMVMGSEDRKIFFNSNDEYFAIGNNKDNIDKYITTTTGTPDFFDKISGSPAGGYVNFQYLMNSMKSQVRDSLDDQIFQASLKTWDNVIFKGGEFTDGAITQHFEINLVDKNTNSLKQLNTYLGVMGAVEKKKKEQREKEWGSNWAVPDTSMMIQEMPDTMHR
jgi:hypothetical protein